MKSILVVDDEFDLASTIQVILKWQGYEVECCPNGEAALEWLDKSKPDLLLLDVMLPFLSGLDVLKQMKRTPGLEDIPVVLVSAIHPEARPAGYSWDKFLLKPFRMEELLGTVRGILGKPDSGTRSDIQNEN